MNNKKPILIVLGEPNSVFIEILTKVFKNSYLKSNLKHPIILIGSKKLIHSQCKKLKKKLNFELLKKNNGNLSKKKLYLIDVQYHFKKPFEPITIKSRKYIENCFNIALSYLNSAKSDILINGPVSKKHFLNNKFPGVTEYIFSKSKKKISKKPVMLIFNKRLSVSPITTHIPLKNVHKNINRRSLINQIETINNFYKKFLNLKPKIAIIGLNPHCETKTKYNEEQKIILPTIRILKRKNIKVDGPHSADTFFLKKNIKKYNTVIGMYHDQVLTPFKTIFEFDASNITLGLPFLRISVDHGPNVSMLGKNKSDTKSIENVLNFINSIR